ncbi:MAG: carbon-nitrogen hydrolase family protein [Bryobacterales bacterium]
MRVAAYQAPLLASGSMEALELIRTRVKWCEAEGITILCCPEAILGGLADYAAHPNHFAISADAGRLDAVLAPLASNTVTTIIGFTELASGGRLHNSAAVFQRGAVHRGTGAGLYRKLYPAIRKSVYAAGCETPVFQIGELTFGIVICNDSNYFEPARLMAARGATALFVPTNNGLPPDRANAELVAEARNVDIARAVENSMWVIRADVAGRTAELVSHGSSGIVDPDGKVVRTARQMSEDLIVAEIGAAPRATPRLGRITESAPSWKSTPSM